MKITPAKVIESRSYPRAFTLIEMMVVIGIIALLAALTLGISNSVMRNSEIHQTEDALKLLSMALEEWELERGRPVTFEGYIPIIGGMYDVYIDGELIGAPTFGQGVDDPTMLGAMKIRSENVIALLRQSDPAKDIISKIVPDLLVKDVVTNVMRVEDAWGTPIGIVFPGRNYVEAYPSGGSTLPQDESGDMTVRDQVEDGLGSCINLRPYFVSAGPDKLWGYRFQANDGPFGDTNIALWKASLDNIYSYDPYIVEEAR